jgi:glucosamine--fructose-6-phosphate aminotransferase (isomerizing)
MCGVVAYIGSQDAVPVLVDGLKRLEYRGYDSAGIAVVGRNGELKVRKSRGRVAECFAALPARFKGSPGIGHTRWATHGRPSDGNAHPHTVGTVSVVHNGVIENADELRASLKADGAEFGSETDSEVLAHLIARSDAAELDEAVRLALAEIVGTYGIAVIDAAQPDRIVLARNGSPVVIGIGEREMFAASDVAALVGHSRQIVHLDDGELAVLRADGFRTFTLAKVPTAKLPSDVDLRPVAYERGDHEHYLIKEIHEQPDAVERTLRGRLDTRFHTAHLGGLNLEPRDARAIRRVKIIGCGSAYYAGQIGAQLIEELARIPADAEAASEFRYRNPVVDLDTLYVAVSQSGETYDTLAAVQELQRKGGRVLGLVNVVGSAIGRQCDGGIYLHAGPEQSVASSKAYTSMAVAFGLLALYLGRIRDLSPDDGRRIAAGLAALPGQIEAILADEDRIRQVAAVLAEFDSVFYVGRVRGYPVAREGAQKLKEISYIHAEAYQGSELKHGPLALVCPERPTVAIIPDDELLAKNLTMLDEIRARHGRVIAVAHTTLPSALAEDVIVVPRSEPELDPILLTIPLQLLAYHAALALGRDIDRPRNLAKSVTVE